MSKILNVLIACEESQTVCLEFRKLGHEAYSCDIQDCSGGHPEWHLKMDCFEAIELKKWDLIIAHPPCTYLTVRAQYWNKKYNRDKEKKEAIDFFLKLTNIAKKGTSIAIENPVGIMSSIYKKPSQIIQPYMFGDQASKRTCLWLFDLPHLNPTNIVKPVFYTSKTGKKYTFVDSIFNKKERKRIRSKTFPGIAKAMAIQWGDYLIFK